MKASDYGKRERFTLGVVELVQKSKNCGKESCEKCPHRGYWYARMPSYFVREGAAREVYLGRAWTDADLRKKVAVLLLPGRDKSFLALLDQQVLREEIACRLDEGASLVKEQHDLQNEMRRRLHLLEVSEKNNQAAIEEYQKRLKKLSEVMKG